MLQDLVTSVVVRGRVLLGAVSLALGLLLAPHCASAMPAQSTHETLAGGVPASLAHAPGQHREHGRQCDLYATAGGEILAETGPRFSGLRSPRVDDSAARLTRLGTGARFAGAAARWSVPVAPPESRDLFLTTGRLRL